MAVIDGASASRVSKLAADLSERGIDAFFASSAITMGYLHGLREEGHERFLTLAVKASGEARLIAPALTETQARRVGIEDIRTWKDGEDPLALFAGLGRDWNLESAILAVDDSMPAQMLLAMQQTLPAALFKAGGEAVASLMSKKDETELGLMRKAARIADEAFDRVLPQIAPGLTEARVDRMLRDAMSELGGEPAFCIVATGANGAEPHHLSDGSQLESGDVVILDFGCDVEGYKSDITRTVGLGKPDPEAFQVYDVVYRAHMAGRKAARIGATGEAVDGAARSVIEAAGYGERFFHRTGHGIGMSVHEPPNMVEGNRVPLVEGNVFSVEPGVYLAGRFGVRIENIVTAGEGSGISLNAEPSPTLLCVA